MKKLLLSGCIAIALSGCAPEIQVLQQEIRELKTNISEQKKVNNQLQQDLGKCNSLANTLDNEKQSKQKDMTFLKAKTRLFIRGEYDTLNRFSKNKELMDYMGGELIKRKEKENSELTVINFNPFPTDAVIYSIKGVFDAGTNFIPQLFRKRDKKIICVWQGPLVEIQTSGLSTYEFKTPLNTMKGDYFGFYFLDKVTVPYDTRTGKYSVFSGKVELGEDIPSSYKDESRNYSIGIVGFLEEI